MRWNLYKTHGLSLHPKVKNNSIAILTKSRNNIYKIKEGTIVAVDIDKSTIAHVYLGIISNSNKKKYIATAPFKYPRIDALNPIERFKGTISYTLQEDAKANKINVITIPFILLYSRSLLALSYFICGLIYSVIIFDNIKVKNMYNILVDDFVKWVKIWTSYTLRRL